MLKINHTGAVCGLLNCTVFNVMYDNLISVIKENMRNTLQYEFIERLCLYMFNNKIKSDTTHLVNILFKFLYIFYR